MVSVNTRELTHNFAHYLKQVQKGQRVVVMVRNKPVATLSAMDENVLPPWKRVVPRVTLLKKGMTASEMVIQSRREARY